MHEKRVRYTTTKLHILRYKKSPIRQTQTNYGTSQANYGDYTYLNSQYSQIKTDILRLRNIVIILNKHITTTRCFKHLLTSCQKR